MARGQEAGEEDPGHARGLQEAGRATARLLRENREFSGTSPKGVGLSGLSFFVIITLQGLAFFFFFLLFLLALPVVVLYVVRCGCNYVFY